MEQRDLKGFILVIIIIGLTLVIGIYIVATMQTNFRAFNTAGSVTNETGFYLNGTQFIVDNSTDRDFANLAVTSAVNASDGFPILIGNFTVVGNTITNATADWEQAYAVKVSYSFTYTEDTITSDAGGEIVDALAGGSAWITILVVVGFAVIVLGMLSEGLGRAASGMQAPEYTY